MIQTAGFDIDEVAPDAPDELKAAALRTYEALLKKWERERIDADTHYRIDIPSQTLDIQGEERAKTCLKELKRLKVRGSYRVYVEGSDA